MRGVKLPWGEPPVGEDVLWRCEDKSYSYVVDADREEYGVTDPVLELTWHHVRRRTPCGAWLGDRFVRLTAAKQWASETREEAVRQLRHRRRRQAQIYAAKLRRAEYAKKLCDVAMESLVTQDVAPRA